MTNVHFLLTMLTYLGYVFDKEDVHPSPIKIQANRDTLPPSDLKQLQAFLGLRNFYSRFLSNYSTFLAPLYELLAKDCKFHWGEKQKKCFETVKDFFCSNTVLKFFNPDIETLVETDSSSYGIAAALMQRKDKHSEWHPVQFVSRTFSESEKNYSNVERESLSVVFGCERSKKTFAWFSIYY